MSGGDNDVAVTNGQAETGRVITAAGLIMILVFLSFSLINNALVIQEFGIGFAVAIIIDAFVVRTVLVPLGRSGRLPDHGRRAPEGHGDDRGRGVCVCLCPPWCRSSP